MNEHYCVRFVGCVVGSFTYYVHKKSRFSKPPSPCCTAYILSTPMRTYKVALHPHIKLSCLSNLISEFQVYMQPLVKSSGVISACAPSVASIAWCDWPRLLAQSAVGEGGEENYIGKYGLGKRNERRQKLVDFSKRQKLIVANTWFQQEKRRYTWKSSGDGACYQLDYHSQGKIQKKCEDSLGPTKSRCKHRPQLGSHEFESD